ncbi:hypothetical protein J3U01_08595 [Bifidobacterium sp. B4107]|uniref:hypothetical protein n=1 Tax=unclassified Bifidobacterium TaxID=2608897 RepID=UPI00226B8C5C|nr:MULTISPECIES: hypothetical protein [unclassified Bifidobacterium]MCX8648457.1 hypothetical protein [Bifidobacterium sp. B4107]MCX8652551.1 hypothetical protein [Bifidobacterium sp. B4111]MCX8659085.1 hypothetical protein [Bifidobacterium sp. B4114]
MQHPLIIPPTPAEQLAALAAGALDAATRQQTGNIGSVTIPTAGGTKLVAGQGAGDQGFAPWVGDTTAPGMPTGISVDSSAGMILVSWDGTLQGGVPADFDHVQILVDGADAGQLRVRGTAALGPYEADSVHQVTVRAWDDAHAEDGSPAPNGSDPTKPVSVTVKSVVDQGQVQAAQDKAQDALDRIAGVSKDAQQASKDAQAASVASAQAKQAADAASGLAGTASSKADSAAASATAASNKADTALSRGVELVRNPAFDPAWGDLDGFGLGMGSSGAPAAPPSPYTTYGALTQRDYFSSWRFPLDRGRRYRFGFWCICDGKGREDLRIGWRYVDSHTHWDEAVTVTQEEASSWVWREAVASTPDQWTDTDHSMSVWLNIAGYGDKATGWWITGLTVRDVTDSQDAKDQARQAQATADGKNRIIAAAAEPAHGGLALGDLWMQLDQADHVSGIQVWNGKAFVDYVLLAQQVLVAGSVGTISLADGAITAEKVTASEALLKKLLVRKVKADEIDVGTLAAAIVKSGSFATSDGLVGFDSSGFWAKGEDGGKVFAAGSGGVRMTGSLETSSGGDRLRVSRQYLPTLKRTVGAVEGLHDSDSKWALTGFYDAQKTEVQLAANGHTPNVLISSPSAADRDTLVLTGHDVEIGSQISGSMVSVSADDLHLDAGSIWARGVRLPVSLHAWGGYADHAGAWEISLRSAKIRYGGQPAVIAPALQAAGLRIPVSGYWLVYGSINIGGSGTPTVGVGVYDQASKAITSYGEGYIADFSASANTWITQAMPPTLLWLDAGDVIMWRTSAGVNIGGGANSLCADLMPY